MKARASSRSWRRRRTVLAAYREQLAAAYEVEGTSVLRALLHLHHLRMIGSDPNSEQTCQRLARSAAVSWLARTAEVAA